VSDERLRELERRWKESGSHRDEGIYLRARVRAGLVAPNLLVIAAYLGSEGATLAAEEMEEIEQQRQDLFLAKAPAHPLSLMLSTVSDLDASAGIRACIAAAREVGLDSSASVEAAEAWVVCPCDRHMAFLVTNDPDISLVYAILALAEGRPAANWLARIRPNRVHGCDCLQRHAEGARGSTQRPRRRPGAVDRAVLATVGVIGAMMGGVLCDTACAPVKAIQTLSRM
jgi:hypothetical protein